MNERKLNNVTKEEIKEYLKNNLKIAWDYNYDKYEHLLVLKLEGQIISKIPFELD